jgi:nucleoside 2-deoxyribosyltransferase
LHLLRCSRVIAIVENKSAKQVNLNIAMEWGFMLALGKPVLYLEANGCDTRPADWSGLLRRSFEWDAPEPGIEAAIMEWLASPVSRG